MHLARSSYRLQLHRDFTFKNLRDIIPYLERLGISTIYAAPIFGAMPGSNHGYDVVNPHIINPEIGTLDELREIARDLKARNMQWLQDIVPNHMAFSSKNPWLYDVMEKGPHSAFYRFFDINWLYPEESFYGKLMVPTLGTPLKKTIRKGEIVLHFGEKGFYFAYYDHHFPVNMRSYVFLTTRATEEISHSDDQAATKEFMSLAKRIDDFVRGLPDEERAVEGWETLRDELLKLSEKYEVVKEALGTTAQKINQDQHLLEEQIRAQYYRLSHWRITNNKINYRRFFTVNDLICLNMQEKSVFDTYHRFIKQLLDEDLIQGIRVDHVDGLLDPATYVERLRELAGPDTYITVEKILEGDEKLPSGWPIQGSSGYDFLAQANQLLTRKDGTQKLLEYYHQEISHSRDYSELVFYNKRYILEKRMAGDLENLVRLLHELDILPYEEASPERQQLKKALGHFLVYFPVYRTYSNRFPFFEKDMHHIRETFALAEENHPELSASFQRLREIFNGVDDKGKEENENKLYFNLRSQQFTGPLAAKGVEDTTFYQYFPLVSLNEVGDSPENLGISIEEFHEQMEQRALKTMNTTATHDTKRGEDARMRISVLSEIPEEWIEKVTHWQYLNEKRLNKPEGQRFPDKNDEYFFYQILIGTYPFHISPELDNYQERLLDYLLKSIREAKVHSSWSKPNKEYREAYLSFAEKTLNDPEFASDFENFAQDIARTAAVYSLGQTLLRITAPGVPDTYQGTEFWDLSMVDPDNRRPVNYEDRNEALNEMESVWQKNPSSLLSELGQDLLNPRIKLFTLYQSLNTRKLYRPLFDHGQYVPVKVEIDVNGDILAFRRHSDEAEALVVIPLGIRSLDTRDHLPLGTRAWKESKLKLGESAGEWHHVFLNQQVKLEPETRVSDLLDQFPVALLIKN